MVAIVLDPRHGDRPVSCDAQLVSVRRKGCPQATRDHATGALVMTATEAAAFLNAAPAWMFFFRCSCMLIIDDAVWIVGFKRGTPYRL